MVGHPVTCQASSRTDAGVHAAAMPVNFLTTKSIPLHGFVRGLNAFIGNDVAVLNAEEVPLDWNARAASRAKTYGFHYQIGHTRLPLQTGRAWYVKRTTLDVERMREASQLLVGEHDFSAFRASGCTSKTTWRRMYDLSIDETRPGELISLHITGNAFLRHMVRIIAGTLFEVGVGRKTVHDVAAALRSRERPQAGVTAGPEGLTLLKVHFEGYPKLGPSTD